MPDLSSPDPTFLTETPKDRHDIVGAMAFAVSAASAAVHGYGFYLAQEATRIAPHAREGGAGFALMAPVWWAVLAGIGLALLGGTLLLVACVTHRGSIFSILHLLTLVALMPFAYAALRLFGLLAWVMPGLAFL